MIKVAGLIIVIASSIFAGCVLGNNVKLRVEELIYVKKLFLVFRGEVEYKNAMLSDAFQAVALRAKVPYDKVFSQLSNATEINCTEAMSTVFKREFENNIAGNTYLNRDDIEKIKEIGDTLGYQNRTMQLSNIDLFVERLELLISDEQGKVNDTVKVYRTLSMMTGLFIAILLL